jgi:hypothetical protein
MKNIEAAPEIVEAENPTDLLTPEHWRCIDCDVNTAPGMLGRAEMDAAIKRDGGAMVTIDNKSEIYTVKGHIWRKAGMEPLGGCLCVGCIEKRLGRKLRQRDFERDHPFNNTGRGTMRLLERLGYTAR